MDDVDNQSADQAVLPSNPATAAPFNHAAHPRHTETGQFVPANDVHHAMARMSAGVQERGAIPKPAAPRHPNQKTD